MKYSWQYKNLLVTSRNYINLSLDASSKSGKRQSIFLYIFCDQQNPYVPDGVAEKLEFFSLRKKKPGPDKILYHDRKKDTPIIIVVYTYIVRIRWR